MDEKTENDENVIPFEPRRTINRYLDKHFGIWRVSKMLEDIILEEKRKKKEKL